MKQGVSRISRAYTSGASIQDHSGAAPFYSRRLVTPLGLAQFDSFTFIRVSRRFPPMRTSIYFQTALLFKLSMGPARRFRCARGVENNVNKKAILENFELILYLEIGKNVGVSKNFTLSVTLRFLGLFSSRNLHFKYYY